MQHDKNRAGLSRQRTHPTKATLLPEQTSSVMRSRTFLSASFASCSGTLSSVASFWTKSACLIVGGDSFAAGALAVEALAAYTTRERHLGRVASGLIATDAFALAMSGLPQSFNAVIMGLRKLLGSVLSTHQQKVAAASRSSPGALDCHDCSIRASGDCYSDRLSHCRGNRRHVVDHSMSGGLTVSCSHTNQIVINYSAMYFSGNRSGNWASNEVLRRMVEPSDCTKSMDVSVCLSPLSEECKDAFVVKICSCPNSSGEGEGERKEGGVCLHLLNKLDEAVQLSLARKLGLAGGEVESTPKPGPDFYETQQSLSEE